MSVTTSSTGLRRPTGAPAWARRAAHAAALTPLPSGLWRIGLAFGFPLGYTQAGYEALMPPGLWGPVYVVVLSVLTEFAALLTIGLVNTWGEVFPRWVPFLAGRRPNPKAVTVVAGTGAAILAVLWTPLLAWWAIPHDDMTATGYVVVGFLYLPMVAWAPLLTAVTVSYHRRHRSSGRQKQLGLLVG